MLRQHKLSIFIAPFKTCLKPHHYNVLHTDLTHTEVTIECRFMCSQLNDHTLGLFRRLYS